MWKVDATHVIIATDATKEALKRLERDLQSLRSASETVWSRGRSLIDRLASLDERADTPSCSATEFDRQTLIDFADRLNEITDFVECGFLAARNLENEDESTPLSVLLSHAVAKLRELARAATSRHAELKSRAGEQTA
jgi:hypothetical protein